MAAGGVIRLADVEPVALVVDDQIRFLQEDAADEVLRVVCGAADGEVREGVCDDGRAGLEVEGGVGDGEGQGGARGELRAEGEGEGRGEGLQCRVVCGAEEVAV